MAQIIPILQNYNMRLRIISELRFGKATKQVRDLLATMSAQKRKHSKRVGKMLHQAGVGKVGTYAGLLHDYIERGGDIRQLISHAGQYGLPARVIEIVRALSVDEKNADTIVPNTQNQPLVHLQNVLPELDYRMRNIVILAKMADRIDNLAKRAKRGHISGSYRIKSNELLAYLRSQYNGKPKPFRKLMRQYEEVVNQD